MKIWLFVCMVLAFSAQMYAKPYLSEFRGGGFTIQFQGDVDEKNVTLVRTLQRKYIENLKKFNKRVYFQDQLENQGVAVKITYDDYKVPTKEVIPHSPPNPQTYPYNAKQEAHP